MRRREFMTLLGSAAAAWPLAARAQQPDRARLIGMLLGQSSDPATLAFLTTFKDALQRLGWTDGRNVRINARWAVDPDRLRTHAAELVGANPDVIVAGGTSALVPLRQATQTLPIVFAQVSDPVRGGFVESLTRPSGNITGIAFYEYTFVVKWLELLKQIAPPVTRVCLMYDPTNLGNSRQLPEANAAAPSFGMQSTSYPVRDPAEIERALEQFKPGSAGGLMVLPNPVTISYRDEIISLAAKHRLPAVYPYRFFVISGGLASYGVDISDLYRGAASYVDRILRGEKPGELPVQFADKFELVINLKTAKALGLDPPLSLLARTDEVIE